jgi:tetratricopeptide (TPR) repeat protein
MGDAEEDDPDDGKVLERAESLAAGGDPRGAVTALEQSGGADAVDSFVAARPWDGTTEGLLDAARARFPQSSVILYDAACYNDRFLADHEAALACCEQLIERDQTDLTARVDQLRQLRLLGRGEALERALAQGRTQLQGNPNHLIEAQIEAMLARRDYAGVVRACVDAPGQLASVLDLELDTGRWQVASPLARVALEQGVRDPDVLTSIGSVLQGRGALSKAVEAYRAALDANAAHGPARVQLVSALRALGRLEEAGVVVGEGLAESPDDKALLAQSARLKFEHSDIAGAIAGLDELSARDPAYQPVVAMRMEVLLSIRALDEAAALAGEALMRFPNDVEVLWWAGAIAAEREEYSRARELFERMVDCSMRHSAAVELSLGLGLSRARDLGGALTAYRRAYEYDPDDVYSLGNMMYILWRQGRYRAARETFAKVQQALDHRSEQIGEITSPDIASFLAGVFLDMERDFAAAEGVLREAQKKGGDQPGILIQLVECYRERQSCGAPPPAGDRPRRLPRAPLRGESPQSDPELDGDEASEDYWSARETYMSCVRHLSERLDRHETIDVRMALGRVCLAMGDLDNARDHFESARRAFPELPQPWAQLGVIATHAGQHRSALRFFEHALERDPDDLTSRTNLAEACRKSRLADRAETEYRRVLAIAHGNVEARVGLAELYLARGEESGDPDAYHEAITYLAQALDYGGSDEGSKWLKRGEEEIPSAKELAAVLYSRGYAKVKLYEASGALANPSLLNEALQDFRECRRLDLGQHKAERAILRLEERTGRFQADALENRFGPPLVVILALVVFLFSQVSFYFGWPVSGLTSAYYVTLTFSALLFAIAGLGLPRLLKLKVAGIELERSSVTQVSSPVSLGIGK